MQKLITVLIYFGCVTFAKAQGTFPTIKATSTKVDIRVGSDFYAEGGWKLEPQKNPDVFKIGSKWPYDSKKVTFTTDMDSISFDTKPGQKYDFIILLNDNTPCHIQIETSADPLFLNKKITLSILSGFALILMLLYWNRNRLNNKMLLHCGYAVTLLFWIMTIISGKIHGNYNHVRDVISELGAIGTASELFTSLFLMLLTLLGIIFSIGFYRASKVKKLSVIPAILSFVMPLSMLWAGIFTMGNEFHGAIGPLPLLLIIGSFLTYFLWRKNQGLTKLRNIGLISAIIMLLILTRFIASFGNVYPGLVQRFFYISWTMWTVATSYYLIREIEVRE